MELEIHGPPGVEIRCCCDPTKLYGWLPLHGEPRIGQRFRFALPFERDDVGTVTPGGEVLLEVATVTFGCEFHDGCACEPERHPALKYHGDDLSFVEKAARLRHVPGFVPSPLARALLPDPERR